jgi:hypothetical protein
MIFKVSLNNGTLFDHGKLSEQSTNVMFHGAEKPHNP